MIVSNHDSQKRRTILFALLNSNKFQNSMEDLWKNISGHKITICIYKQGISTVNFLDYTSDYEVVVV